MKTKLTQELRDEIVAAVEAAQLSHPADVADRCFEAVERRRSWRRVIDRAFRAQIEPDWKGFRAALYHGDR